MQFLQNRKQYREDYVKEIHLILVNLIDIIIKNNILDSQKIIELLLDKNNHIDTIERHNLWQEIILRICYINNEQKDTMINFLLSSKFQPA
jgi:hypothetical protein